MKKSSLPKSNVDCAVAKVAPGMVASDGAILDIGPISSQTVGAALNQAVKKSGRKGSRFLDSGDSGSLMVEDVATRPRAVGLLFAGSSSSAIANPINQVLQS